MKLCVLGGGSVHTPALIEAFGQRQWDGFTQICLFDRDEDRLRAVGEFCQLRAKQLSLPSEISWSPDLEHAVEGASFLLNQIRAGGTQGELEDQRRLAASGIVAHAASYAETLRIVPAVREMLPVIERRCPDALFVNFSNPVSAICECVAAESQLKYVGLCYHTSQARMAFARYLQARPETMHVETCGINHVSFVTDVTVDGKSRFRDLADYVVRHRLKTYNYDRIGITGMMPIGHAYSVLGPRELWYVRQNGVVGSLSDILLRFAGIRFSGRVASIRERTRRLSRLRTKDVTVVEEIKSSAPWYALTVVPFLFDFMEGRGAEHTLTVGEPPGGCRLGGRTTEVSCHVEAGGIRPRPVECNLPEGVLRTLRRVVESETRLIAAMRAASFDDAVHALEIHPNVYSRYHAERFLRFYLPVGGH